jgi:hypothetical protein
MAIPTVNPVPQDGFVRWGTTVRLLSAFTCADHVRRSRSTQHAFRRIGSTRSFYLASSPGWSSVAAGDTHDAHLRAAHLTVTEPGLGGRRISDLGFGPSPCARGALEHSRGLVTRREEAPPNSTCFTSTGWSPRCAFCGATYAAGFQGTAPAGDEMSSTGVVFSWQGCSGLAGASAVKALRDLPQWRDLRWQSRK